MEVKELSQLLTAPPQCLNLYPSDLWLQKDDVFFKYKPDTCLGAFTFFLAVSAAVTAVWFIPHLSQAAPEEGDE